MDDKQKQRQKELTELLRNERFSALGGLTILKFVGLVALTITLIALLIGFPIQPAKNFVAYEWGTVKSSASEQSDATPPGARLLIETLDGDLVLKSIRASEYSYRVHGDKVCLKKYKDVKSEKKSYMITLPRKCAVI